MTPDAVSLEAVIQKLECVADAAREWRDAEDRLLSKTLAETAVADYEPVSVARDALRNAIADLDRRASEEPPRDR